jgi:hypothetical protein
MAVLAMMFADRGADTSAPVVARSVSAIGRADAPLQSFYFIIDHYCLANRPKPVINRKDPVDKRHLDAVL